MVLIDLPPPPRNPNPIFHILPSDTRLFRIFDPSSYGATAISFRDHGPLLRFDHHRGKGEERESSTDTERGIYYAAPTLSSCLVEMFGDTGVVEMGTNRVAAPILGRDLRLLDLRANGAMRAGTKAAVAKVSDRMLSQAWSRYFYDTLKTFAKVDGLLYLNAHNDEDAVALYERARDALLCPPDRVIRLDDEAIRAAVLEAANDNDLLMEDI